MMKLNSPQPLQANLEQALTGNRDAMEYLLRAIQPDIYKLCLRFLMTPHAAEDATQEILLKVTLRLSQFEQKSNLKTWVFRIATNHLLDVKKGYKAHSLSFDEFGEDLQLGAEERATSDAYSTQLQGEIRIGCTLAILQCLNSDMRLAYILGEILELEQNEAAMALAISAASFRKRLSRARQLVLDFMQKHCGLVEPHNACRCHKRVRAAQSLKRIDKDRLIFMHSAHHARQFPLVLDTIRQLKGARKTAALFRAQKDSLPSHSFEHWLKALMSQHH